MRNDKLSKSERKRAYLIHLFEVNRPYFSQQECLGIIAARAGYGDTYEVKRVLKKAGKFW